MWRSRTIFAILVLVAAIPLIAHNLISRNAVLSVPNDQVNFEIDADGRFVGIVNLTNCGTADAVVDGVRPSCGCTSVAISAEKVAPGAQLALKFAIDPKHTSDAVLRYDFANGLARLRTSCEIHGQFQNSDPQDTAGIARVVAEGQYQLPFRISESELHLGDLAVADYEVSFRIRILGLNHSDTVIIREVFPGGIASVKPTGNEDDCCWLLELKVNPSQLRVRNSQKAVSKTSTIKLEVRSGSLHSLNFQLPIHYRILSPIDVNPSRVILSSPASDVAAECSVTLKADGHNIRNIERCEVDGESDLRRLECEYADSDKMLLHLRGIAKEPGVRHGSLTLNVFHDKNPAPHQVRLYFTTIRRDQAVLGHRPENSQ